MRNAVEIEGLIYEFKLEEKINQDTKKGFIQGTVSIATDSKMENIVTVNFYANPTWKNGSENQTYTFLKKLLKGEIFSVMNADKEKGQTPEYVLLNSSALRVDEWYDNKNDKLVEALRNYGGFFHTVEPEKRNPRATFDVDMVITKATRFDEDEEKQLPERMMLSGFIFNYNNDAMPIRFELRNPKAMSYFEDEGVGAKNPMFTRIKGSQVNQKIVTKKVTESLFDEDIVDEMISNNRVMLVTNIPKEPYDWDDESTITVDELKSAMHAREIVLAEKLAKHEENKKKIKNVVPEPNKYADLKDEDFGF